MEDPQRQPETDLLSVLQKHGLVAATNNRHKIIEIKRILQNIPVISLGEAGLSIDVEETGSTFEENALIKARAVFEKLQKPSLSDDSGIEVDALNKEPGVFSARYGGELLNDEERTQLLLKNTEHVEDPGRTARFVCVLCLVFSHDQQPLFFRETVEGRLAKKAAGKNGFGYDPVFIENGRDRTFGELPPQVKDENSHRARALRSLARFLFQQV